MKTPNLSAEDWEEEFDDIVFGGLQKDWTVQVYLTPEQVKIKELIKKTRQEAFEAGKDEGRESIINKYDEVIAEFGDQGIEVVGSILDEWFHSHDIQD